MIKGFSYGPLRFEAESAKITIGKLKCEPWPHAPSTTPDPMKTMVEQQQIAINSLIDRVNKLEEQGKDNLLLIYYKINWLPTQMQGRRNDQEVRTFRMPHIFLESNIAAKIIMVKFQRKNEIIKNIVCNFQKRIANHF